MLRIMQVAYTDERGDYRLFWLPPGRYNVAAEVNDPHDELALHKLQECFPDRKLVAIDSRSLVWGLGSFHCLTQQVPAARTAHHSLR